MPHFFGRDASKAPQWLSKYCKKLESLEVGYMFPHPPPSSLACKGIHFNPFSFFYANSIMPTHPDDFRILALNCNLLSKLDLYYCHDLESTSIDSFLSSCVNMRNLRLPCFIPSVIKTSTKIKPGDSGNPKLDEARRNKVASTYHENAIKRWVTNYPQTLQGLEVLPQVQIEFLHSYH